MGGPLSERRDERVGRGNKRAYKECTNDVRKRHVTRNAQYSLHNRHEQVIIHGDDRDGRINST